MAQIDAQPQEPGVLARLSSTVTAKEGTVHAGVPSVRLVRDHYRSPAIITLTPQAEDRLLALLLARKGITLAGEGADA